MPRRTMTLSVSLVIASLALFGLSEVCVSQHSDADASTGDHEYLPTTIMEARTRARILHETIHGVLQVVHRDFFDSDQRLSIPSRSLEDVFKELERSWQVKVHWLAVNADAMNVDNKPRDEFEKEAVTALSSGKQEFDALDNAVYRYVGSIRLASQCLKCHAPRRTSNDDRAAGLVITMTLRDVQ